MVALTSLLTTFDGAGFMVVGLIGLLLGVAAQQIATSFRWPWLAGVGLGAGFYFIFGGAVALPRDAIAGILPSLTTEADLARLAVTGWKALLTTWPPVAAGSEYLVLVWLFSLVFGLAAFGVARASRSPQLALVAPIALLVLLILLSAPVTTYSVPRGLAFVALLVGWAAVRTNRRNRLASTGQERVWQVVISTGLAAATLAAGFVIGPAMPGVGTDRLVLRTFIQPPLDVSSYPSPLPGLSKFASPILMQYFDTPLLTVTGAGPTAKLRLAVLDQYDGTGWSATGTDGGGFRPVGSKLSITGQGQPSNITVTITADYAGLPELCHWVPALGPSSALSFGGRHAATLAYDVGKGQALVIDGLVGGDTIAITTYPVPWLAPTDQPVPGGDVVVPDAASAFLADPLRALVSQDATPWSKLASVGQAFVQGYWSDGTKPGEGQYMIGDGQGRLEFFFAAERFVGSDEQYAAAFALAANRFGFPARVVFGASVGIGGVVHGRDLTAWVEIQTTTGWVAVPQQLYIPDRDRTPDTIPPNRDSDNHAIDVPPPNPVEPPSTLGDTVTQATAGRNEPDTSSQGMAVWLVATAATSSALVSLVLLAGLVAGIKALRSTLRRHRGSPVTRIAAGWRDMSDRVRDTGVKPWSRQLTYQEQAARLGLGPVDDMVSPTQKAMFGPDEPTTESAAAYWRQVDAAKAALLQGRGRWRAMLARVSARSLLSIH